MCQGHGSLRYNRVFEHLGLSFCFSRLTGMQTCTPIPVAMGLEYHIEYIVYQLLTTKY